MRNQHENRRDRGDIEVLLEGSWVFAVQVTRSARMERTILSHCKITHSFNVDYVSVTSDLPTHSFDILSHSSQTDLSGLSPSGSFPMPQRRGHILRSDLPCCINLKAE